MHKYISRSDFESTLTTMPPFANYVSNLEEMKNLDMSSYSLAEIERKYFDTAIVFPGLSSVIPSTLLNNVRLYRVRRNINFKKEDLFLKETYSYPPTYAVNENGRANLKGKPVFYCGHTYYTALKESKINTGDIAYMSVWNIIANRNCEYGAFLPDALPDNNPWKDFHSINGVRSFNSANNLSKSQHLEYLHSFIAELFIRDHPPYSLTSWLADKMLLGYSFIDFIVYPSFELNSTKCNIVFKTEFVDQFINLERVYILKATEVTDRNVAVQIVAVGETGKAKIEWRDSTDDDEAFLKRT